MSASMLDHRPTTSLTSSSPIPRVLVLISGAGTNLSALIRATNSAPPALPACITHVISSRKAVKGLDVASSAGIPTTVRSIYSYNKNVGTLYANEEEARNAYNQDLVGYILRELLPLDLIICAGWMLIFTSSFLQPLSQARIPVINLHPALPHQFDGKNAIQRAWESFQRCEIKKTGVMIHYVIEEIDRGEPIVVEEIDIHEGEELDELENRIHKVEWKIIVEGARRALEAQMRDRQI